MDSETDQNFAMESIKKQAIVPSLEEQAVCFIDFLNCDDFIENPRLRHFYVQLVSLYHAAVSHGMSYTRSKRYYLSKSYVILLERHKPEGEHRIKEYSEIRIISKVSMHDFKNTNTIR